MNNLLEVVDVEIAYNDSPIVKQVSFNLAVGRIGCLLGPSGCGKTTLLRAIAGFQALQAGEIRLHNHVVSHAGWQLPPEARHVGMVFQDFALFPHLRVAENIGFGLRLLAPRERRAGAYTLVREHFKPQDNAAIGRQTGFFRSPGFGWGNSPPASPRDKRPP